MRRAWDWLAGFFTSTEGLDQAEEERRKERERIARLARDPFAFRDRASWLRFRRKHGYTTRRLR